MSEPVRIQHRGLVETCPRCRKRISEEEYVVNWASCRECFADHLAQQSSDAGAWQSSRGKWPWRDFLTTSERAAVDVAERRRESARLELAAASAVVAPIQNRAIQRAKFAARKASHPITKGGE